MADPQAERARLTGYIAASQRVQRRLAVGLVVAAAPAIVATLWVAPLPGRLALLGLVIVGVCGFWVTAAHIADWKMQLRRLDGKGRGRAVRR
ncbi:MAG: hypothetical protein R3B06_13760 [Kofleriaceae bacterium]